MQIQISNPLFVFISNLQYLPFRKLLFIVLSSFSNYSQNSFFFSNTSFETRSSSLLRVSNLRSKLLLKTQVRFEFFFQTQLSLYLRTPDPTEIPRPARLRLKILLYFRSSNNTHTRKGNMNPCLLTDLSAQRHNQNESDISSGPEQYKSEKLRINISGSQHKGYSQHLQYLDSSKSSAKDLSLPTKEIVIRHTAFNSGNGLNARGPRPNGCPVSKKVVDNTAQPAWIPTQRRSVVIQQMVASRYQLFSQPHLPSI